MTVENKEDSKKEDVSYEEQSGKTQAEEFEEQEERKQRRKTDEKVGIAHIYSTYNNTHIHITDMAGHTICQISGGKTTKHSRLKATPTVAMFSAKRAAEIAKEQGINSLYVKVKSKARATSAGPGSHAAIKSLSKNGLRILNILDVIPIPRGGPKVKGGKRGRRV